MNLHNMLEYSDNYAYTTASLYQYKRPVPRNANGTLADLTANNSSSFKYQSGLVQKQLTTPNSAPVRASIDPNFNVVHRVWKNIKIVVLLKYISNFFRNLELPLINTELYAELNWAKYSVLCNQDQNSIFQITKSEMYIPVVTFNAENNNKLSRLLSEGLERTVIWNEYKSKIETVNVAQNDNNFKRTTLDTSFQGVSRLFAAACETGDIQRNTNHQHSSGRYYLPRAEIKDYNVLIDGRNFYDQNVNSSM